MSRSSICYLPTSERVPWQIDCPCIASLGMEIKVPSNKAMCTRTFLSILVAYGFRSLFLLFGFCILWTKSMSLLRVTMFPSRSCCVMSALFDLLNFSWMCWELSCWHCPSSLYPLPLLLSLPLSLCLKITRTPFLSPSRFQLQFMTAFIWMSARRGWIFFWYECIFLCKRDGKNKGNDRWQPMLPTPAHNPNSTQCIH